jgi:SsrA-binding protein
MKQDKSSKKFQPIENKKAHHDYTVTDTLEAGIELKGWEVKSLRLGRASLKDSHVRFMQGEACLVHMHVTPYQFTRTEEIDETRSRRLLIHKNQLIELQTSSDQKGLTIIPLKVYLKGRHFKVLLGLARGKKIHEKRAMIKERDLARDAARELRGKNY